MRLPHLLGLIRRGQRDGEDRRRRSTHNMTPNRHQATRVPHLRTELELFDGRFGVIQVHPNSDRLGPIVFESLLDFDLRAQEAIEALLNRVEHFLYVLAGAEVQVEGEREDEEDAERGAGPELFAVSLVLCVFVERNGLGDVAEHCKGLRVVGACKGWVPSMLASARVQFFHTIKMFEMFSMESLYYIFIHT
jgi:hypothetical protein